MIRKKISKFGNSAAVVLSRELLNLMDVKIGEEVELTLVGRSLLIHPISEVHRSTKIKSAMERVFQEDAELLKRLA